MPLTDHEAAILAEFVRRQRRREFGPEAICSGPQLRAVVSPAKRKVLCCGRRAGKTTAFAVKALSAALTPPIAPILYATLTRANAKDIIWDDLLRINDEWNLGGVPNVSDLVLTMPSGVPIQLRGLNNDREIAKIRGKRFKAVFVDEMQSIPDRIVVSAIQEIIAPTLIDYGGELWLGGTRAAVRAGYWWDSYAGRLAGTREQHAWTVRDNEKLPARVAGGSIDSILANVREENGWSAADPTYRREFENEDIEDLQSVLYEFSPERNACATPPTERMTYVVGVDIGHDDSDAIVVLGWQQHDRRLYLIEEHVHAGEDVEDLAERLKPVVAQYKPIRAVIDQGGLGKKIAETLRRRHRISLEAAEKHRKPEFIKMFNADMRKGLFLAPPDSRFADDAKLVRKDRDALLDGQLQELTVKRGGYHSDVCDAVLYAWRWSRAYREEPAPAPAPSGGRTDVTVDKRIADLATSSSVPWWEADLEKFGG